MKNYSRRDLPILGVSWFQFDSLGAAERFASWAEITTRNDRYPCEATVTVDEDRGGYRVKVANW